MITFEAGDGGGAWATAIAALLGGLLSLAGTVLSHWLLARKGHASRKAAKEILKTMLHHPQYRWRKLSTLANAVGLEPAETRLLLLELGARGHMKAGTKWGLVSRNPLKTTADDPPAEAAD